MDIGSNGAHSRIHVGRLRPQLPILDMIVATASADEPAIKPKNLANHNNLQIPSNFYLITKISRLQHLMRSLILAPLFPHG